MYSIWVEPTAKDSKYLMQIICKLAKKHDSPSFNPHITVYSGVRNESAAKHAIQNCAHIGKFAVNVMNLEFSDNLWKTVFANVEKNRKLTQIHDAIKKAIPLKTKYEFNPHISLIYKKLDDSKKQGIIDTLAIKPKIVFDKITIIASSKYVGKWEVIDRLTLK
jgi:2'-5' RNA ligase